MGEYEDTLKDIEKSLGIVPGFMKALPTNSQIELNIPSSPHFFSRTIPGRSSTLTRNKRKRRSIYTKGEAKPSGDVVGLKV